MLMRSYLDRLTAPGAFLWATGIECTFITDPWPKTTRMLDEYALIGHYERRDADLDLMASLGITTARYGIPWYRINPAAGTWDWDWTDRALEGLLVRGIDPIIDLVHYGVPAWMEGAFLHPDFPHYMAEYAARVAERYKGRIHAYTPLNEARIAARYGGRLGWWPPYRRGGRGYVAVLLQACRGIVWTCRALQGVDPETVIVHVEGAELYSAAEGGLEDEVTRRQLDVFLTYDLITGQVTPAHLLWPWLRHHGASDEDLGWFVDHALTLDIVGINLYPVWSNRWLIRSACGIRSRPHYGSAAFLERLIEMFWERYRRPLMITETASRSSLARRCAWLDESLRGVRRLRERGIPLIGYTWYPMLDHVVWAWRQRGERALPTSLGRMGLWDIGLPSLVRVATPLVDRYRHLVCCGDEAVGPIAAQHGSPRH